MGQLLSSWPFRRKRFWRYVSPRRRGVGLVLLAALLGTTYLYWYYTNDRRVTDMTEQYLQTMLGGKVRVENAHFGLFGGLEIRGVRLWLPKSDQAPGSSNEPFFHAKVVEVRHKPWSLLAGQFVPTQVFCSNGGLTINQDERTGKMDVECLARLWHPAGGEPMGGPPEELPAINFRNCTVRTVTQQAGLRQTVERRLDVSLVSPSPAVYRIAWEFPRDDGVSIILNFVDVNLHTGQILPSGKINIEETAAVLPQKYRDWCRRYDLKGEIRFGPGQGEGASSQPAARAVSPAAGTYRCELVDGSMQLPAEQGGLAVDHVHGIVVMSSDRIEFESLQGRLRQAGNAEFTLKGHYDGYTAASPFALELTAKDMAIPALSGVTGPLAEALAQLELEIRPQGGLFQVSATLQRKAGGKVQYAADVAVSGLSLEVRHFPYRVQEMAGRVLIDPEGVHLRGITARRGASTFKVWGDVQGYMAFPPLDISVEGTDVAADDELAKGLEHIVPHLWASLSPSGVGGATVRIVRLPGRRAHSVEVSVRLDGRMSGTYQGFDYRLRDLTGEVHILDNNVTIHRVAGRHGQARVRLDGKLMDVGTQTQQVDLSVEAWDVPVGADMTRAIDGGMLSSHGGVSHTVQNNSSDANSAAAGQALSKPSTCEAASPREAFGVLGAVASQPATQGAGAAQEAIAKLGLGGQLEHVTGRVTKPGDGGLSYDFTADLAGGRLMPEDFAYELKDCSASVHVTPERVAFEHLVGRHGSTKVEGGGFALPGHEPMGLSLDLAAKGMAFDKSLLTALSKYKDAAAVVAKLSPVGQADVELALRSHLPDTPDVDYTVTLQPRQMQLTYADFPYAFGNVTGTVVAKPGRIEITQLLSHTGKASAELKGTVLLAGPRVDAQLAVKVRNMPIDAALLKAAPGDLQALAKYLSPAGTCSLDLSKLHLLREPSPIDAMEDDLSDAAGAGGERALWSCQGTAEFTAAVLNIGQDPKTLSGKLTGTAAHGDKGLEIDAAVGLDALNVGPRTMTDLHGRIVKTPVRPVVRIEQVAAKLYSGLIAGEAEIRLGDVPEYAILVEVDDVDLSQLVNAGVKDPSKRVSIVGRLGGSVAYSLRPMAKGRRGVQEAAGSLQISKAKMGKLPVMLDLLHFLYLSLPGDSAFAEGEMTYHLKDVGPRDGPKDERLVLNEIHFKGPGLSLLGSGTVWMKNERLSLTFLTAPANKLPGLELLEGVLQRISREITEVRVTGTLSKPLFSTRSLQSVDGVLRMLLNPESAE